MWDKLSGYRTYVFIILYGLEQILRQLGVLHIDPAYLGIIETTLITGGGISVRAAIQKAHDAADDAAGKN